MSYCPKIKSECIKEKCAFAVKDQDSVFDGCAIIDIAYTLKELKNETEISRHYMEYLENITEALWQIAANIGGINTK